jgi:hypothetical protein
MKLALLVLLLIAGLADAKLDNKIWISETSQT